MNYRIFNMRTWLLLYVCVHTGVGNTDSKSLTVLTRKNSHKFVCAPDAHGVRTFEPLIFGSGIRRSNNWAIPSPRHSSDPPTARLLMLPCCLPLHAQQFCDWKCLWFQNKSIAVFQVTSSMLRSEQKVLPSSTSLSPDWQVGGKCCLWIWSILFHFLRLVYLLIAD